MEDLNINDVNNKSEDEGKAPGERWDPLGADDEDIPSVAEDGTSGGYLGSSSLRAVFRFDTESRFTSASDTSRIRNLEEEQEILANSLMALTTHFAQVQFRLRQIVDAPIKERDELLRNLEEFAFRGIPETNSEIYMESDEVIVNLERARARQFELIDRLKRQLSELEKVAYESGAPVLPQSIVIEKQKVIIDELKNKLNLNLSENDLPQLSSEDLKSQVDSALGEFVGPLKMKEQLVAQLKTQITDLERFIAFLQHNDQQPLDSSPSCQSDKDTTSANYNSYSAKRKHARHTVTVPSSRKSLPTNRSMAIKPIPENTTDRSSTVSFGTKAHMILSKASTLLQMFALTQFGCGASVAAGDQFQKNTLKKSARINHWGDTRAQLEVDIQEVAALARTLQQDREKDQQTTSTDVGTCSLEEFSGMISDSDDESNGQNRFISSSRMKAASLTSMQSTFSLTNAELTSVVRRNLAVTLQRLIQHGLRSNISLSGNSLVPFISCFHAASRQGEGITVQPTTPSSTGLFLEEYSGQIHAWELILQYYIIKNGDQYNQTPSRKLSQSFNLDIVSGNGSAVSNKQTLLSAIGSIIAMHKPYKRSYNSYFKAFVCAALNARKLVIWLNLIFQCSELINTYYLGWSYVAQTGFRDALHSLDTLTNYEFDLPVDLAIRQFENIKDVFM